MSPPEVPKKPRICFVVSAPESIKAFLTPHITVLAEFYEIDVVANFNGEANHVDFLARSIDMPIRRTINPINDFRTLLKLHRIFRRQNYAVVHSVTPKAGLLSMAAARAARVPVRIHWFTGQVWATRFGIKRKVLKSADRMTALWATHLLIDSPSQRDFLIQEGVVKPTKADVLAHGSICGVDTDLFKPDSGIRASVREELGIPESNLVVLFLSRINRDKGVFDLASAMPLLTARKKMTLVMAGFDEQNLIPAIEETLVNQGIEFIYVGPTDAPHSLMAAADIFCAPSHREGFGLSVIEASSTELPCIASNIYGFSDAVVDGRTGLLFPSSNPIALAECLQRLINDAPLRTKLGELGRQRVLLNFTQAELTRELRDFYATLAPTR